ncbi:FAD-dependent monooxygenase [Streptomyces sp. NPDC091292]|uniref:FAD-dependent monooxygenase n=1 Tax=Streptomyces sp. NPDC091292 TaxID=3365991 RepID=UPI0038239F32
MAAEESADEPIDVLVVGAGPTGLALAVQLRAYGLRFRIIDRHLDRARESRALAVQPRTLEALAPFGVTDELVARGNPAVGLRMHFGRRGVRIPLYDIGATDTPYPFLLLLSQAQTESVLADRLGESGVTVERGTELVGFTDEVTYVGCRLKRGDGTEETVSARYVVGCDGARSTVREQAGIGFAGRAYPQTFLLADLEVDGLEGDGPAGEGLKGERLKGGTAHAYLTERGMIFFFPLGSPATWRLIAMRGSAAEDGGTDGGTGSEPAVSMGELQSLVDRQVSDPLRLRDAVWMTSFRIYNRGAKHYRSGRAFLAGDAAHIHSPAGGQGMNTGIQDALNLGWKLALVCQGAAPSALLDTYEDERAPVGRNVRRFTDRAFRVVTSDTPLLRLVRAHLAPRLAPLVLRLSAPRRAAFRTVSQLGIHYRHGPATTQGPHPPKHGPQSGDRLPDSPGDLHTLTAAPGYHLLLCGPPDGWNPGGIAAATRGRGQLVHVHTLATRAPWPGTTHCLVRPDGYIGYLGGGTDVGGLLAYLDRWLPAPGDPDGT